MATDPYWNNVVLAMRMDDTGLTDLKGHTVSKLGNVARSATQSKFGVYSAYFDGSGDYITLADSEDFDLGSGDFTIELFVYRTTATGGIFVSKVGTFSSQFSFIFGISADGAVFCYVSTTGTSTAFSLFSAAGVVPTNVMKHVAFVRSGSTIHLCVEGVSVASTTFTGKIFNSTVALTIGAHNTTATAFFTGYIDELRITKGIARYPGDIPTESLPSTPPQLSGTVTDLNGALVARLVRSHRRSDGLMGGEVTSSAIDGTFTVNAYDGSAHYVVCFDDDLSENAIILDNITPII